MNPFETILSFRFSLHLRLSLLALLSALGNAFAQSHDDHNHAEETEDGEHGVGISLAPEDMKDFSIRVATAGPGLIREELRLPGEIRMNENSMAHVSPRFEGAVKRIHHRIGDKVKAGDVLAEMESNETLRPFTLIAPIDGTIVDFHITIGEIVSTDEYAYVIADTSTIWADLRVYQRDLPKVHKGQQVRLFAGHDYPVTGGVISYVGPVVDETSRTGLIRAVVENPHGLLRPGLFVVGDLSLDEHRLGVVIPRTAVHTLADKSVVFVATASGQDFDASPVRLGRGDTLSVEILEGLRKGQRYVSEGGFFLKAESQKENFGDGHAH